MPSGNLPANANPNTPLHTAPAELSPEVIRVTGRRVACDGGGGAMGHPRVWLNLGDDDHVTCPYCSREYILAGSAHDKAMDDQGGTDQGGEGGWHHPA